MMKLKNKIDRKKYMKKNQYQFELEFYTRDRVIRPRSLQQKNLIKLNSMQIKYWKMKLKKENQFQERNKGEKIIIKE